MASNLTFLGLKVAFGSNNVHNLPVSYVRLVAVDETEWLSRVKDFGKHAKDYLLADNGPNDYNSATKGYSYSISKYVDSNVNQVLSFC